MSERQKKRLAQKEANKLKRRMIEKVLSNSKTNNVAFNLNFLVDGWLELESDPGTFSLLIEDFGCLGAQVEEIYDLEQKFDGPVFGFIFLFKWLNHQPTNDRTRNQKFSTSPSNGSNAANTNSSSPGKTTSDKESVQWSYVEDENVISNMFFAKQMISNSCATHALISILLNCDYEELNLGPSLTRMKEHTKVMNPENKGYAIGNLPELAKAHNSHASYSSLYNRNRISSHSTASVSLMISGNQRTNLQMQKQHEAYHFVSYVPINDRLYELDGLKEFPIDHGPIGPGEDWTDKFRTVIKRRLFANKTGDDIETSNDIRYSLMAVVPDKRVRLRSQLNKLKYNHKTVQDSISQLTKKELGTAPSADQDIPNPPYSPLSNRTVTASEVGSVFNSPRHLDDCFLSDDDDNQAEKAFFVKFNPEQNLDLTNEDNSQPAHKNCIMNVESTDLSPMDLTLDGGVKYEKITVTEIKSKDQASCDAKDNNGNNNVSDNNHASTETQIKTSDNGDELSEKQVVGLTVTTVTSVDDLKGSANGSPIDRKDVINETKAHKEELYNLSSKPPFDFNILDELQHIHSGKSMLRDLKSLLNKLDKEIEILETSLKEETDKRRKYKIDNSRRTHNYEPFIMTFLSMLAKQGNLADLIEKDLGIVTEDSPVGPNCTQTATPKNPKAPTTTTPAHKLPTSNGTSSNKANSTATSKVSGPTKPKYKYVSTGRPVGRPRKNPLVPPPAKTADSLK